MRIEDVTYGNYLKVDELLSLQQPLSEPEHPDELQFIIVHQAQELWFKLVLADLERVIDAMDVDDFLTVLRVMRRVNHVITTLIEQIHTLEDLPAWSLHQFRGYLGTASGLQSRQFRELELVSGLRDRGQMEILKRAGDGDVPPQLVHRLEERSLAESYDDACERQGLVDLQDLYVNPQDYPLFHLVSEAMMDYDVEIVRWRRNHVGLIERILGPNTRGTAGMPLSYLIKTTEYRFFPRLWDVRHELVVRSGGELIEPLLAKRSQKGAE